jgi:2',3'-cyclic-nucleotide 2'-phosphodiesterase (5'-nucleotidase family)
MCSQATHAIRRLKKAPKFQTPLPVASGDHPLPQGEGLRACCPCHCADATCAHQSKGQDAFECGALVWRFFPRGFRLSARAPSVVNLTFVVFSDIYEMAERDGRGGFARTAAKPSAVQERHRRARRRHAVAFVTSSVDMARISSTSQRIGLDVFTPGNHGSISAKRFFASAGRSEVPLLAANLRDASGHSAPGFADSKIIDVDGVKVGLFGLTDDEAARRSSPGSLKLLPAIETAKRQAKALRDAGADLVVVVTHSEWQDDLRLAKLGSIDIVLSGHDHNLFVAYDGRAAIG